MTREQKYTAQMKQAGIYNEAFAPVIGSLCEMERDRQRIRKAWKADGCPVDSEEYRALEKLRRDILSYQNALGLTPAGMKRIRGGGWSAQPDEPEDKPKTILELLQEKREATA